MAGFPGGYWPLALWEVSRLPASPRLTKPYSITAIPQMKSRLFSWRGCPLWRRYGFQAFQCPGFVGIDIDKLQARAVVFDGDDEFVGAGFDVRLGTGALAVEFAADKDLVGLGFVIDMPGREADRDPIHLNGLDLVGHRVQHSAVDIGSQQRLDGGFQEIGVSGRGVAQQFSQKQAPGLLELAGGGRPGDFDFLGERWRHQDNAALGAPGGQRGDHAHHQQAQNDDPAEPVLGLMAFPGAQKVREPHG